MPREKIATWPSAQASRVTVGASESLSGNRVISVAEIEVNQAFIFNPGATARNVDLPAAAACAGVMVFIGNAGTTTGTLTIRDAAAATIDTIAAPAANNLTGALLFCTGAAWFGLVVG